MRRLAIKDLNQQCLGYIIVCALAHWSSWTATRLANGSLGPVMGFFLLNCRFHNHAQNDSAGFHYVSFHCYNGLGSY